MATARQGSNIVIDTSIAGSVFPSSERDIVFPVLVDGTKSPLHIEGAIYGRSLELRGAVEIDGPVVVRGDTRVDPRGGVIALNSGLTVNGSLNAIIEPPVKGRSTLNGISNATVIIKGDVAVNQNVAIRNAIVFGSVRAVNCTLENTLILGTCIVEEHLKVVMSTIGGYASRDVAFEGRCMMLQALGESRNQPLFLPFEQPDGAIVENDVRFYPAIRSQSGLMNNQGDIDCGLADFSRLYLNADWVPAQVLTNPALEEESDAAVTKWVLSIGGRIADFSKVAQAITAMTNMLKCGFEFEHYHPSRRASFLERALAGLTSDEAWLLKTVCRLAT